MISDRQKPAMLDTILNFIRKRGPRRKDLFDSIQVEITSRCSARCIMCPRTSLDRWQNGDMSLETFQAASPFFNLARHVHLQGWGEPLLHPDLERMIEIVKKQSTRAGFTTNGEFLSMEKAEKYIDLGLDVVAVSLAGADRETHEAVRAGTDFEKIIKNIRDISRLKAKLRSGLPLIIISFIMLQENINHLSQVIELAADIGADRLTATNMDLIASPEMDRLGAFHPDSAHAGKYRDFMKKMEKTASSKGIELRLYPLVPEEQPVCEAYPLNNLYISFDGCLSPCPYLGLPVTEIPRYTSGRTFKIKRTCFGNINSESIPEIWEKGEYIKFRDAFRRRLSITAELYEDISCDFEVMEKADELQTEYNYKLKTRRPPHECSGCWKLLGI